MDLLERFLRPLRAGIVTSRYPAEPPLLAPGVRGLPELDPAACTLDGACVTACPTGAIRLDRSELPGPPSWSIDSGACIFCGACARACPSRAIALGANVELAVRTRGAAVVVTTIEGDR